MDSILLLIATGAAVGFAVGLTGVGGGSLMTPLLLLFGYSAPIAIGTDLLYAGITKMGGIWFHHRQKTVHWGIVGWLAIGSLPSSLILNFLVLDDEFRQSEGFDALLTTTLGVMLVLTAVMIALGKKITAHFVDHPILTGQSPVTLNIATVIVGIILGVCVTLSSVGAAAFGTAVVFILYPRMKAVEVVGTNIAHAVPLTLVAGLGYLWNDLVDIKLLLALLCGSLPGIWMGAKMSSLLPDKVLRNILVVCLMGMGLRFILVGGH